MMERNKQQFYVWAMSDKVLIGDHFEYLKFFESDEPIRETETLQGLPH